MTALKWTEERPPDKECSYNHVFADTPFGRIEITWKGWKDQPIYDVEFPADWDCEIYFGDDVEDGKKIAERVFAEKLAAALPEVTP